MENFLMEERNLKQAAVPADANGAAITGARLKMDARDRVAVIVSMGDSTAAVVSLTLQQHDAAAAGNSKALEVANPYYVKADAATVFTKVEPSVAAATYDLSASFASAEGIAVFEVLSEELDNENGFNWMSLNVADTTAAKIVSVVYATGKERNLPAYGKEI